MACSEKLTVDRSLLAFRIGLFQKNHSPLVRQDIRFQITYHRTIRGCAHFHEILQNFSERQILWSLCSVVFHALTLKLPIQTSLSVAPTRSVFTHSGEKGENFSKMSTPLRLCFNEFKDLLNSLKVCLYFGKSTTLF